MKKINWDQVCMFPEEAHRLEGSKVIKEYCMGGNAIVTLSSPSGVHHSYYIRAPWRDDKDEFEDDVRFVYVLDSVGSWKYVGGLYNNGRLFRTTYNSWYTKESPEFKGMQYIVRMMNSDFHTSMVLQHEGCCARCGKKTH